MNVHSERELHRLVNQIRTQLTSMEISMKKPGNHKVAYGAVLALLHHVLDVIEQTGDDEDPIGDILSADSS